MVYQDIILVYRTFDLRSGIMPVVYQVREKYGFYLAKDMTGDYVTAEELQNVIELLQHTHRLMLQHNVDQETIEFSAAYNGCERLKQEGHIIMPFDEPHSVYTVDNYRPRKFKRYSGVYFVTREGAPNEIKIGKTIDLYTRTRGLISEYQCAFSVVAFIETENHYRVESMFHEKFAHANLYREWFDRDTVETWLQEKAA
jgi:hypothetical protein